MDNKDKIQHAQFIIDRFDHYFEQVNVKGQYYLAVSTLLLGVIITNIEKTQKIINETIYHDWLLMSYRLIAISSTMLAISPYLKSGNVHKYKSLIFFESISNLSRNDFFESFSTQNEQAVINDYTYQIHILSNGLKLKYKRLEIASAAITAQLIFTVFLIFKFLC
jgi:hypothetical protein